MMGMDEIFKNFPKIVSNNYDYIYLLDMSNNNICLLTYNGESLKISDTKNISELSNIIDINVINHIKNSNELREIYNNKFVISYTYDKYKLIFIMNTINKTSGTKSLLIADDSEVITKFFTKIFSDRYNILVARDGNEAVNLVKENKDNLLGCFIDLKMPVKDGYYVLNYFKDNDLFKLIPVSVISGEDDSGVITELTSNYQIVDMLQKPFDRNSAESIVSKTISLSPKNK